MKIYLLASVFVLSAAMATTVSAQTTNQYPFQNPNLPLEERVNNIVSLMTLDEKVAMLSQRPGVPRLGIRTMQQVEGLHGVRGGAATTTYPQSIGLGETWDTDILHQVGATEGYEARYIFQRPNSSRGSLVIRAPNADLGRDPRWGRTEECYGEDPFLNGTLAVAFIRGMQGDDPKYWQAAALLKHFLANSNEKGRAGSSSDFDEQLFYDYYSVPFRMGFQLGGARCFMASYNAWNKIPMTANPVIPNVVVKDWGVDGVICTDAGSLVNMVRAHHYYEDLPHGAAGAIKTGMNQFLDQFEGPTTNALNQKLVTEADIENVIKGTFRIWIRLGLLDPPDRNPYAKIGSDPTEPWTTQQSKDSVRRATQESIVLLKNTGNLLPLDKSKLKSIALIGPFATNVIRDWYGSTAPYVVTPLAGIKDKAGAAVNVQFADGKDVPAAVALAKSSDVAIVCVGNNPNLNNAWMKVSDNSEGREGLDREQYHPRQRTGGTRQVRLRGQSQDRGRSHLQFPLRHQLDAGARSGHRPPCPQQPGRRQRAGRRAVRRLQPGGPVGRDVAQIARSIAADDGLQHPRWPDLHVFQGPAALSLRLRFELHDVQVFRFENQFADAPCGITVQTPKEQALIPIPQGEHQTVQ